MAAQLKQYNGTAETKMAAQLRQDGCRGQVSGDLIETPGAYYADLCHIRYTTCNPG
jgi:hypothetical protein